MAKGEGFAKKRKDGLAASRTFWRIPRSWTIAVSVALIIAAPVLVPRTAPASPTNVQVTTPVARQGVIGVQTLAGTAQDESGTIVKLEFYIDAEPAPACADVSPKPSGAVFQCNWDASALTVGHHAVTGKAYDPFGNSSPSSPVAFEVIAWRAIGPDGRVVLALAIDPTTPTTLYAGTESGGLFKSTDGGTTWQVNLASRPVYALAINPTAPTTLYAGTHDGVFWSTDGGANWHEGSGEVNGTLVRALAINPIAPPTVYAGTENGVFKSSDGGTSWQASSGGLTNLDVRALAIDPTTPTTLYAGTEGGVFKSTNGGATWQPSGSGLSSLYVRALTIDPTTPTTLYAGTWGGGICRSTDAGTTWQPSGLNTSDIYALAIDPTTPTTLYAGTGNGAGIFKSTNGGTNWQASNGELNPYMVHALAVDPVTPTTLFVAADGGVFRSANGGSNWRWRKSGLSADIIPTLAVNPVTPTTLYAGTWGGRVFKSTDRGATWQWSGNGLDSVYIQALVLNPFATGNLFAGTYNAGIYRSIDGGATWQASLGISDVRALALSNTAPPAIYAGTFGAGVLKGADGGTTWQATNSGLTNLNVQALAINPATATILYAGTNGGGVFKSTNGGATWQAANAGLTNLNVYAFAIPPAVPGTVYAATWGGGVFKSSDGGATWLAVNSGLTTLFVGALTPDPTNATTLYAGTDGHGVFRSTDGGTTWRAINSGLANGYIRALAINSAAPETLYAGTGGGGVVALAVARRLDAVGAFRPSDGTFYLDANSSGQWDGCSIDKCIPIGISTDTSLVGDWNGSSTSKVGAFRPSDGTFYLDYNGSGTWDGCGVDRCLQIGMLGDIPLIGDWNGTGTSKAGAFRPSDGTFYLDYNGSGTWDGCGVDRCLQIGMLGDMPLVGDWNGSGTSKVGAFRPADGTFYLDYNGNGTWDGCGVDRCLPIGVNGDTPLVGDWNGSGTSKVGTFRPSDGTFYLDYNGNGAWDGCATDRCLAIGIGGDTPLVGDWNGTGTAKVGAFRPSDGTFYLDYNGSGTWDGCAIDRCLPIGLSADTPLVGKW